MSHRLAVLAGAVIVSGALVGCTSATNPDPWELSGGPDEGGTTAGDTGASQTDSGASPTSDGAPPAQESGAPPPDTGAGGTVPEAGAPDGPSAPPDAGTETGPVSSSDGFSASRTACINKINALRATDTAVALQPYTLANTDTVNSCVDKQATNDQGMNNAHYSFGNNAPSCPLGTGSGASGQNECLSGYGTDPAGLEKCLQDMWDESLKPNCQGCIGCTTFGGGCPNCDYSGTMGYECGHYVNMSAPYFTTVACGFAGSAPSSPDGWSVQNFE
jgi:hypothetical protein